MKSTSEQFESVISQCKNIFYRKMKDYGAAWRILRPSSLTDQIYIKANRIRNIQTVGEQKINDSINNEFMGVVNYSIMALIQLELGCNENIDENYEELLKSYDSYASRAKELMENKNHDYGEAWRNMRISSISDIILMKLLRIKQIEDNKGITLVSEGVDANYFDIINYAVFALILLTENN